jgi:hypothetical protein
MVRRSRYEKHVLPQARRHVAGMEVARSGEDFVRTLASENMQCLFHRRIEHVAKRGIASPIKGFLAAAATACHFGADAQDLDRAMSGFAVAPPAGYVAMPSAPASPSRLALHLTKPAEPGVACEVSFEVLPGFEHFSQEMLNRQTDNPDWEAFYRDGLGDFYRIASIERFDHAGVRGAMVSGISKPKPTIRNWASDQPTLIFIFYTPKGLSKISCVAPQPIFEERRAEFEAVARGITLAQ